MVKEGSNVRQLALEIARKSADTDRFLEDVLDGVLDSARGQALDERDRRLLRELVLGSCRRRVTLDHLIARFSSRPLDTISPALLEVLRQAVYQVVYLERIPAHAAVNEAVELARRVGHRGLGGFANAVLRALCAAMDSEGPAKTILPTSTRLVYFGEALLPDPADDLAGYLSIIGSMPRLLVERWLTRWSANTVQQISEAANAVPGVYVHPNGLRTDVEGLERAILREGRELIKTDESGFFRIRPTDGLAELDAFRKGLFWVMDPASSRAAKELRAEPGNRVLDLCSAPGTKTALIVEHLGNTGQVVAVDVSEERLKRVRQNVERLGMSMVTTVVADGRSAGRIVGGGFDRVLVDAPCSNTGVLSRRVQARHRFTTERLAELTVLQRELLEAGLELLKPGGRLVYSTCSLEEEENEGVVAALRKKAGIRVESSRTCLPEADLSDGGFVATLVKGGVEG